MLGIEAGKAELKNYSSEYQKLGKKTIDILENIIGTKAEKIEHVGSTSIIGIKSKPIIDIAIGVKSFDIINEIKDILEQHDFIYSKVKLNNTVVDFMCEENGKRTHNIHFVIFGEERWKEFVLFRDYLNSHNDVAKEYENLKMKLSEKYKDDIHRYTENKSDFILNVLAEAQKK